MGALDRKLHDCMQLGAVDILERVGVIYGMVTHDQEKTMTMAGRIAIMNRGKFVQIGEPKRSTSIRPSTTTPSLSAWSMSSRGC